MKKKFDFLLLAFFLSFLPSIIWAIPGPINSISDFIGRIFNIIWPLFIGFSVIMFIYAGILFLGARGEKDKLESARQAVLWGTVGIIIGILAFSIPFIIGMGLGTGL